MPYPEDRSINAFTLVELSIVIVIIGLIIAGITAGRSLVKSAQLNSIITDINKYNVAINSFYLQYNALPGDLRNASSYWGGSALNGDGNNQIDNSPGLDEDLKVWQHLALAGLIPGTYSGTTTGAGRVPGTNCPASSYRGAGFGFDWYSPTYGKKGNAMAFAAGGSYIFAPIIPASEALAVDTKMDDGVANKGRLITHRGAGVGASLCVDQAITVPATTAVNYILTDLTASCRIWYYIDKRY